MATKVQSKTYFPGSMMDLNNSLYNGMWDSFQDDRVSVSERSPCYDPYLTRQTMNGYAEYPKEQIKLTILKQESIFRQQLQELHRVHKRQRDLMNDITMKEHYNLTMLAEAPKPSHFLSQVSSQFSKEMHTQRRVIDLELPADLAKGNEEKRVTKNAHNLGTKRAYNLADLNEPVLVEEASFAPSFINKNCYQKQDVSANSNSGLWFLQAHEPKKPLDYISRKRTLFGVELCESSHTPSSSQSAPRDQNISIFSHNRWIGSSDASRHIPDEFNGNNRASFSISRFMTNGLDSKVSVSDFLKEAPDKYNGLDGKNEENLEKQPLSWLMNTKGKETTLYQMNMDSLQHHSQQFFKKVEKVQTDNCNGITKILGVPITDVPADFEDSVKENGKNNCISEMRHHIDLNLSFDEEEDPSSTPFIPAAVVKIASMEIDLEVPAAFEDETDDVFIDANEEVVKDAAEAIVAISSSEFLTSCETSQPPQQAPSPADTVLRWFAEVIESGPNLNNDEESVPEDMDHFEYMSLKLEETDKMYEFYKPMILEEKEEDEGLLKKRTRKGQGKRGRQRRDFQRDVLPGIVSLSRREVTEDLQMFEEAFSGIGVSWQSKRKACNKNARGRRHLVVPTPSSPTLPPQASPSVAAVEQSVCREAALEKSLRGWGKRTRRLPRQRCQNNNSNHHSLALKC
nr:uncharacterized protein LOC122605512 isoform X2 [Erigeron canadensis]